MTRTLKELLAEEKPELVASAREEADRILMDIHLAEIRRRAEKTQTELAAAMGVKQPTIAKMERDGQDVRLSSLKRYIESLGGRMSIDVELPDGSHHGFSV
ncbi:helix-turn-helix domain-containing protein [Vreelandella massiliensis]|uniref:helix-turn-helix domain-containing protein n=1 Tax=Vreelandella massiliensis TaxID=1816686 RepID=UPI00096A2A16|nr:helix-turn-helix domain-containing protein [Halomonas massiliensis]